MRRRGFIFGSAALASVRAAAGETPGTVPIIGFLALPARVPPSEPYFTAFDQGLKESGFVAGDSVKIEYRFANNRPEQLPTLAAELVQSGASLITTPSGLPCIMAAKQASPILPVIAILGSDAIEAGLIKSLNRPGGNVTGVIAPSAQIVEKQLELARELVTGMGKVGVLIEANYSQGPILKAVRVAGARLNLNLVTAVVANETELAQGFDTLTNAHIQCVVVPWTPLLVTRHEQITQFAMSNMLPDIYAPADVLARGGLMSYGGSFPGIWRQLGVLTAKVLAGAKPAELPVEFPARIELRINLKTAKSLGLTIPPTLLARADEVVE